MPNMRKTGKYSAASAVAETAIADKMADGKEPSAADAATKADGC
jgi:hypothetical protein